MLSPRAESRTVTPIIDDISQLMLRQILVDECIIRHIEPDSKLGLRLETFIKVGFLAGITERNELILLASNLLTSREVL